MSKTHVHPVTRWSISALLLVFFFPCFLVIAYFLLYAAINQASVTPVNDIIVQAAVIYGVSGLAIIDLGEQAKKSAS